MLMRWIRGCQDNPSGLHGSSIETLPNWGLKPKRWADRAALESASQSFLFPLKPDNGFSGRIPNWWLIGIMD